MKVSNKEKWKVGIAILVVVIVLLIVIWHLPYYLVEYGKIDYDKINDYEKYHQMINAKRATIIQVVGGILFIIGLYVANRRAKAMEGGVKASLKQVNAQKEQNDEQRKSNRETLTLEQYTRAIDQLGNDNIAVRLGGIYSLAQIMNSTNKHDSKYHDQIIELLTAYVRDKRKIDWAAFRKEKNEKFEKPEELQKLYKRYSKPVETDVRAILTVLGHRVEDREEKVEIDLKRTSWIQADLSKMKLNGFNLSYAFLNGACLIDSKLEDADLENTCLEEADLRGIILKNTKLGRGNLKWAFLSEADIKELEKADDVAGIQLDEEFVEIIMNNKEKYPMLYNEFKDR